MRTIECSPTAFLVALWQGLRWGWRGLNMGGLSLWMVSHVPSPRFSGYSSLPPENIVDTLQDTNFCHSQSSKRGTGVCTATLSSPHTVATKMITIAIPKQ
eukprot:4319035-Amphidinium_carterae.1